MYTVKVCAYYHFDSFGARMNGKRVILGGLDKNVDRMSQIHNMLLTGCGTSGHAGLFAAKLMRDLDCFDTVSVMDSAEVYSKSLGGTV
jgi:fructoselysine-6-P-deglycase FrlB-like protein